MKWVFYVIVFVYMFYRAVYGLKTNEISNNNAIITLDNNADNGNGIFVEAGQRKILSCKASGKNQKIEWINPEGQVIPRLHSKRVYASQFFVQSPRAQAPSLLLNISKAEVQDSGIWLCKAGDLVRNISICVIDPTDFEGTPSEVDADEGRSYTLSCQTKGEPEAAISWIRHGRVISEFDYEDTPKYRVMTKYNSQGIEGLLTIMSLSIDDSGVYTCQSTQETALADKCENVQAFNVTLNINHAPSFGDRNKENVYGTESETLFLRCEADGYPQPIYLWFIKSGEGEAVPIADKDIVVADNGSVSILPVNLTENSFNNQYICQASNHLGDVDLVFNILESVKPEKPDELEMLPDLSSNKKLVFNVTWDEEIQFGISMIEVQSMPAEQLPRKRATGPKENDWKRSKTALAPIGEVFEYSTMAALEGLEPSTEYWVRLRIKNNVGDSPWSAAIKATTKPREDDNEEEEKDEELEEEQQTVEPAATEEEPEVTEDDAHINAEVDILPEDSGRFYGLFFAVGVIIVAVGCTFVARMV